MESTFGDLMNDVLAEKEHNKDLLLAKIEGVQMARYATKPGSDAEKRIDILLATLEEELNNE